MISTCPYCQQNLNLSEAQAEKVRSALSNLQSGILKLGCPHCRKIIQINQDGSLRPTEDDTAQPKSGPTQPPYPDISWLANGMYNESKEVEDIPKVMVVMPEGEDKRSVVKVFEEIGYQVESAESSSDAIAKMRFVNFATIVLHSQMEGTLAKSTFHSQMKAMAMDKRRYIYYILVGSEFHTLYDLEALSNSANLVINDHEIANFSIILRKGLRDYDRLFGPYMTALREHS